MHVQLYIYINDFCSDSRCSFSLVLNTSIDCASLIFFGKSFQILTPEQEMDLRVIPTLLSTVCSLPSCLPEMDSIHCLKEIFDVVRCLNLLWVLYKNTARSKFIKFLTLIQPVTKQFLMIGIIKSNFSYGMGCLTLRSL